MRNKNERFRGILAVEDQGMNEYTMQKEVAGRGDGDQG